jgi:glycosyltransferase involved in cell wall biosynthesis
MRILHIIATLNPEGGGPIESVRTLLSYSPMGYTGEVVTLDDPEAPYLRTIPFPVHGLGPQTSTFGYNAKLVPWLKANRHRFDGVVVNGLWQFCGLATLLAIKGHRPYVVFTHGMLDPYFRHAFPLKHLKKWLYWLPVEYWVLRGAYRVLFTCTAERDLAEKSFWLHRWTPFVVPYGTGGPGGSVEAMRREFLGVYPHLRGKRFLLFLGRIHPKKGCDLLTSAFAKFAAMDPDLHLVMAGPDPQNWRQTLEVPLVEAGCEERVHWVGMVEDDIKWGAFAACEAFILPSHQENFGIAVAEALACGKPALLSDKVNIAEEIEQAGAGYMETDTLQGCENLIGRWLATSGEEREKMAKRAFTLFVTRYDMRENAKTIIGLFDHAYSDSGLPMPDETAEEF